jgi:hypothetical protein
LLISRQDVFVPAGTWLLLHTIIPSAEALGLFSANGAVYVSLGQRPEDVHSIVPSAEGAF